MNLAGASMESVIAPIRAVEYVRMSTEDQKYSIPQQQALIRDYAAQHGMTVIRTYADEGKSGLTLNHREALVQLLTVVQSGSADFEIILVYDVSRWGRFQDVDESAYYEYLCRRCNVRVEYCAEPFVGQTGPLANILKSIKRAMAAEFSREHATKISGAIRRAKLQSYHAGGPPPFALRRLVLGTDGQPLQTLETGVHKIARSYRTVLVPGPEREIGAVRKIFDFYVNRDIDSTLIADLLNTEGSSYIAGRPWTGNRVLRVLRNEQYAGVVTLFRKSSNLAAGKTAMGFTVTPSSDWRRLPTRFPPIISPETFKRAGVIRQYYGRYYRDKEWMLDGLRNLLRKHGRLNKSLISADKGIPSAPAYARHFGGLRGAYDKIGYHQQNDWRLRPASARRNEIAKQIIGRLVSEVREAGGTAQPSLSGQTIKINGARSLVIVVGRCLRGRYGRAWQVFN
jgi:DNA invertase Pin-like site-specific DNA recombinase